VHPAKFIHYHKFAIVSSIRKLHNRGLSFNGLLSTKTNEIIALRDCEEGHLITPDHVQGQLESNN
jgi:hypothetical protein